MKMHEVRLEFKRNFEELRAGAGNVRALVESLFSVKALAGGMVYSRYLGGFAAEIAILFFAYFFAYNVAVISRLDISTSKL